MRLALEHGEDVPGAEADPAALLNLLGNAIKFTPEGGTIGVESAEGRGATFWFRLPLHGGRRPGC